MSRHRVKDVGYDDDDYYEGEDDEYTPDPEEQELLQQCTALVLQQLGAGQPSVTATKEEVHDALWHYYNDIEKSVNYLRAYPAPPSTAHFSAADFFRDCPWLNIPSHRKADILIEPLHPRLGLLGGAPENGGKLSKLAALAAARKKKEGEKTQSTLETSKSSTPKSEQATTSSLAQRDTPLSLRDRLAASGRSAPKSSEGSGSLRRLASSSSSSSSSTPKHPAREIKKESISDVSAPMQRMRLEPQKQPEPEQTVPTIRASPSTFASTIVGPATGPTTAEPSRLHPNSSDLLRIYGQDHAEPFDFAAPSPDDVVLKAQSTAKGLKPKSAASKSSGKKAQSDLAGGMKDLSVEEKVTVKSKNLDVLSEYKKSTRKRSANFVVIGHVDAGKSTLMGRLLADQGAIDQRTLDRYRREAEKIGKGSFALAWVLDQGSEERARGVTIDIATNQFETDKTAFTIVDAPGHRDFVPNMIAGASQADFAVLVIDSSVGKFESGLKGQTKEHALLVRSMGVQKIVVAVNKMDTVQWDHDRFEEIEQQISGFLTTAGFQESNISFVPCSGVLGDNITRRTEDPHASWYTGRTLIEELETSEPYTYALEKPLRMTIGDVFRGGVQNPLSISGRIDAGSLQMGDQILTMPSGETATVRSLEVDNEASDWAVAGQNVVLNIANIDPIHLRSGDVVCRASSPIPTITSFTAKVLAFEHLMPMQVDVHRGRLHVPGRISKLVASLDKASGAAIKKRPKIVGPGVVARIVVEMDQAVPLEAPTRIVLRAGGSTVAAGLLE
ncbi:Translation elongation/initiation factor/Ribosomal beta-barrel [Penicillium paradoxum]|uniref:Translation elongation/initiation factor/Ribosomal beta-barrel n=1 Tax=Penicillium paradoxum TaxID=176176 RepID=UPI0025470870|nr:Translation elongation/initiation factor/Ribosomal beta-barrel [Penicillium paradoxum]KAJ5773320.1 Translation elongation/initiation factor/Ribosomal beta-barrel [Penicillium paradoxum]